MRKLTPEGHKAIEEIGQRYGVSKEAVTTLLDALVAGNGIGAQFSHRELGGSGQWMRGGMVMVGDMFNHALKAKVDSLCTELSALLADHGTSTPASEVSWSAPTASAEWWPGNLGKPSSQGSQNAVRYAFFSDTRRLALDANGQITVYDTLDHRISGVSQQQGPGTSLIFSSQNGLVKVADLPVVKE